MADEMIDLMSADTGQENKHYEVLKDLSDEKKARVFSELNDNEVKAITRLRYLSKLLNQRYSHKILNVEFFIETFLEMRINKDRKSRSEFVESFKSPRTENIEQSMQRGNNRFLR